MEEGRLRFAMSGWYRMEPETAATTVCSVFTRTKTRPGVAYGQRIDDAVCDVSSSNV